MADKSNQIVLDALNRAAAEPAGLPLYGNKAHPGLFRNTNPAKQAAQRCKQEGLLCVVRTEAKGKTPRELCAITEKGLAYLLNEVSPRAILETLVRVLEARQGQIGELTELTREARAGLSTLQTTAERVLQAIEKATASNGFLSLSNGSDAWMPAVLTFLVQWQTSKPSEDCPLPELFRRARQTSPTITIGHFHDGLRRLHEQERIYLHPWSGPLYEIPEPQYALLVGHEIAYYASLRT